VTSLEEIVKAWNAIGDAERQYRAILREALTSGDVQQVEVSRALERTREMIRRDAMTDEQRAELRRAETERRRASRATATKATPKMPKARSRGRSASSK
jgi:hypothetical protein